MPTVSKLSDEVRRFIVAEIAAQLEPMHEDLKSVHEWQLAFWSNGSGRPEGFFQRRMREDDERNEVVLDFIRTEQQRQLESETRKKVAEEEEAAREARWKKRAPYVKWVAGILASLLAVMISAGVVKMVNYGKIWLDEYLKSHPSLTERLKTASQNPDSVYADKEKQEHSSTDFNAGH